MNTRVIIICVLGLLYPYCGFGQALNAISGKESLVHTGAGSEKTEKEKYVYHVYETTSKVAFEIPHYLGEPCTEKWSRFQANYTRTYDQNVGFSSTTVEFAKPAIYHAVNKINKYIVKAVKKKNVTREEAIRLLSHVLDCANTLLYEDDTTQLEKSLASTKEPELLIKIFNQIKNFKA